MSSNVTSEEAKNPIPKPKKQLLFLSIDIESDGPCPGLNNLWSIGLAGFTEDAELVFVYEANLHDLPDCIGAKDTMDWWATQKEAFAYVRSNLRYPAEVFLELNILILQLKKTYKIVTVAWPVSFDFMWFCYYFGRFCDSNPLGFSAQCIESYAWAMLGLRSPIGKMDLSKWDDPRYPHTHKALDDAKEQGARFMNMYRERIEEVAQKQKELDIFKAFLDSKQEELNTPPSPRPQMSAPEATFKACDDQGKVVATFTRVGECIDYVKEELRGNGCYIPGKYTSLQDFQAHNPEPVPVAVPTIREKDQ